MSVEWSSIDPRTSHKVVYGPNEAGLLEAAYGRGDPTCDLVVYSLRMQSLKFTL
jgi:hypothetical protein